MDFLDKNWPQIIICLGVLLQLFGGTVMFKRMQAYRGNADAARDEITKLSSKNSEKSDTIIKLSNRIDSLSRFNQNIGEANVKLGEENKYRNNQIIKLSNRISEQSVLLEKQLTGGESYAYLKFLEFKDENGDQFFKIGIFNDFDFPVHELQIQLYDLDKILRDCIKVIDGKEFLIEEKYKQAYEVMDSKLLFANFQLTNNKIEISGKGISKRYFARINSRNGNVIQKILVKKNLGQVTGVAFLVEKNGEVLQANIQGDIDKENLDLSTGFEFVHKVLPYIKK